MYRGLRVAVVMPAYNVERFVVSAVRAVPTFVDDLVVVDDASQDKTGQLLARLRRPGLVVVTHSRNRGVGAAIAAGYEQTLATGAQVAVVMAGDGQMDPDDLPTLLDPIVDGRADYVKGNRFRYLGYWRSMPPSRMAGSVLLSLLTRLSSGYRSLFDSQCGYTAASRRTLEAIANRFYHGYGYPNDLLARLHTVGARVVDVPVRPVYEGQASGIRLWTVVYPVFFILLLSWVRRLMVQSRVSSRRRLGRPSRKQPHAHRHADDILPTAL